jgi:hypothetical protein
VIKVIMNIENKNVQVKMLHECCGKSQYEYRKQKMFM